MLKNIHILFKILKQSHQTHEHIFINNNGKTHTLFIGTTAYGKSSNIQASKRKPQTTIEYNDS